MEVVDMRKSIKGQEGGKDQKGDREEGQGLMGGVATSSGESAAMVVVEEAVQQQEQE